MELSRYSPCNIYDVIVGYLNLCARATYMDPVENTHLMEQTEMVLDDRETRPILCFHFVYYKSHRL